MRGLLGMKFDPTINLGHMLTAGAMLATGFLAYGTLEKRVSVLEVSANSAVQLSSERASATKDALNDIKADVKDLKRAVDDVLRSSAQRRPQ